MNVNPMQNLLMKRPTQINNPLQMLTEFNKFKQQMQWKDAEAMVKQLLDSGQMSPAQFEQLKEQANALSSLFK